MPGTFPILYCRGLKSMTHRPDLVSAKEVLLEQSHAHLFMNACACFLAVMAESSSCDGPYGPRRLKYSPSGPSPMGFASLCFFIHYCNLMTWVLLDHHFTDEEAEAQTGQLISLRCQRLEETWRFSVHNLRSSSHALLEVTASV